MAKLKQTIDDTITLDPQDEDLLRVLKFTKKTFMEDAKRIGEVHHGMPMDDALTVDRLKEAAAAIERVLPYYTVGGGEVR